MPKINTPPKPSLPSGDKSEAILASNAGDDSKIRDHYFRVWHDIESANDKQTAHKFLRFTAVRAAKFPPVASASFKKRQDARAASGFTADRFHKWVHKSVNYAKSSSFRQELQSIADYIWDAVPKLLTQGSSAPNSRSACVDETFIQSWYNAIDLGASHKSIVSRSVPGIYVVYRASTFDPSKITRGAMLIWEEITQKQNKLLRTLEINQFRASNRTNTANAKSPGPPSGSAPSGAENQIVISEIYHGAAIRKKTWLVIESFLEKEGDPLGYRFALPHDQVMSKYDCLVGSCLVFPVSPFGVPTIRAVVLERVEHLPQDFSSRNAQNFLERRIRDQQMLGEIDLLPPANVPASIYNLLNSPQISHWLARVPQ